MNGATVSGTITQKQPPASSNPPPQATASVIGAITGITIFFKIIGLLSSLVVGFLLLRFVPIYSQRITTTILEKSLVSVGIGILAVIVWPVAIIALLVTIIGIPLALIALFTLLVFVILAHIVVAAAVGQKVLQWLNITSSSYLAFVVGLLLIAILSLLPVLGGIVNFFVYVTGIGALLIEKKALYIRLRQAKEI